MTYFHPDWSKVIRKPPDHGTITFTVHKGYIHTWTYKHIRVDNAPYFSRYVWIC